MESTDILASWPDESREAAQLVVDAYGEPHEATPTELRWFDVGEWKRIVATKEFWKHEFPSPHFDSVESVVGYAVPADRVSEITRFDGSVVVRRTMGELSATCHDEEANRLALNLADDIVRGSRDVADAREYYKTEFLNVRRKQPTPYMSSLRFTSATDTADPDERVITDEELQRAQREGEGGGGE